MLIHYQKASQCLASFWPKDRKASVSFRKIEKIRFPRNQRSSCQLPLFKNFSAFSSCKNFYIKEKKNGRDD